MQTIVAKIFYMNILFVCSRNKWRSRTAETIFRNATTHHIKSAGTAEGAVIKLNEKLMNWADMIFVMEQKHKQIIQQKFSGNCTNKKTIVLDIADDYQYMDEALIETIKIAVAPYVDIMN